MILGSKKKLISRTEKARSGNQNQKTGDQKDRHRRFEDTGKHMGHDGKGQGTEKVRHDRPLGRQEDQVNKPAHRALQSTVEKKFFRHVIYHRKCQNCKKCADYLYDHK